MFSKYVHLQDQSIEHRLPFVGLTVVAAKQQITTSLTVPYFSDAIVNGAIVPVGYVLSDGDRLEFRKRSGIKGGDDLPFQEREAQGLLYAYDLAEIVTAVKQRNLPKDESIDLMAVMIGQWANTNFGPPDPQSQKVLSEILKRLDATSEPRLNLMEEVILETVADKEMTGKEIAVRAGYKFSGPFRAALSSLVRRKILINEGSGYHRL